MFTDPVDSAIVLLQQAASLLVYQTMLQCPVGKAFLELLRMLCQLQTIYQNDRDQTTACLQAYGCWFSALATCNQNWQDFLVDRLLQEDNPFTRQAQRTELGGIAPALVTAARHDLQILQCLYHCDSLRLSQWVQTVCQLPIPPVVWQVEDSSEPLHSQLRSLSDWGDAVVPIAAHYRQHGAGLLGQYRAFCWRDSRLEPIAHPDPVQVTELAGYELQKQALLKNTEFLLQGYPALNVLLYGSRGSGKSSLVKGLLHQYGDRGLRLVEVAQSNLQDLPAIADCLRGLPQKFILFVDDLSFEEEEDRFKALKVVLEGSLTARARNLVVYATSNRRHLIREFFADRPRPSDADEIHTWDTVQEKLSFSDRFGLTLTFEPANQSTYLGIVHHLAGLAGVTLAAKDLEFRALQWATQHNGRSGRTARQFVDFLSAELQLSKQNASSLSINLTGSQNPER
jgi:predicted AAA+ superfamily ATPase